MTPTHPASLGEFLRHEREKRGFTVEQVASATKISLRLLHSLENDLYQELPARPFIRGFVIAYCRFLGIQPQEVLTRFSHFIEEKSEERPRKDAGHSGYAFERKEGDQGRTGLWILMGSMLLIGVLVLVVAKPNLKRHNRGQVERLREANEPSPSPSVMASAAPAPSSSLTPAVAPSVVPSPQTAPFQAPAVPLVLTPSPIPAARSSPSPSPSPVAKPSPVVMPSASPTPAATPSGSPSRRPDPLLSGKDLFKEEIRVRVVVKANKDMWVKFKVDGKDKNRIVLREGITLVLLGKDSVIIQSSSPEEAIVTRSAGEPNALKSLGAAQSLSVLLQSKKGAAEDGRTLVIAPQATETIGNPFVGEAPMSPPPPKPGSGAPDNAPPSL